MTGNYYGCESNKHQEFTCSTYSYLNKKFHHDKWCDPCKQRGGGNAQVADPMAAEDTEVILSD